MLLKMLMLQKRVSLVSIQGYSAERSKGNAVWLSGGDALHLPILLSITHAWSADILNVVLPEAHSYRLVDELG